ncbi:MAG: hypothetical protein KDC35_14055 [Acidobacteria bacterium]|nr:hypothetical protein [Acidobacteriota bacterium]
MFQSLLVAITEGLPQIIDPDLPIRRLSRAVIELGQNMLHHSDLRAPLNNGESLGIGKLQLFDSETTWTVTASNLVTKGRVAALQIRLNQLDAAGDRLKKNVQATLKQPSSGPGGGIGLMQLARWSDGKLKAMFFPHDEGHDRFEVHVTIGKLPTKQQNTEGTT